MQNRKLFRSFLIAQIIYFAIGDVYLDRKSVV